MQMELFGNGTPPLAGADDADRTVQIKSTRSRRCPLPPYSRNAPKGTSDRAAAGIAPHTPNQRSRVYAAILNAGATGLTDEQGQELTGIKTQSYTPRRGELVNEGKIRDTGERRKTRSGSPAAVWVAVSKRGGGDDA